ncbi:SDR family oxidoreductase [Staphylococcus massiliensis CCUG 55927]|uniref:elongation factor P 5-aminopentanone reductase n=1 Tax=Staphylococcus massiliensis TaxID=555791 RepID=UPI000304F372|nr:SDR family NAD(P)-dependent oxidoreductase [Staphylococcus massiliensis]POA00369.1 SDR family oxidoreductase [Staphylococcus massiliensis CCUG 55927]
MKALVLGGSGSIGKAIVHALLEKDYEVILHYHHAQLNDLENEFKHQPVTFVQADLSQTEIDINAFDFIQNLDALIYVSGQSLYGQLQDMNDVTIDACYNLNVKHLIGLSRHFIDQLRQSDQGRIVVVSSIWGETGASFETIYSTMKGAQLAFVKALAKEVALTSVTVNALAPGIVRGRMTDDFDQSDLEAILEEIPQQRLIAPSEVAHACIYLLDPMSQSITGTVHRINGGWYV